MHILHIAPITQAITDSAPGGAEQVCVSLAAAQVAAGHTVSVLAASGSRLPPGIRLLDAGIPPGLIVPIDTSGATLDESTQLHRERRAREGEAFARTLSLVGTLLDEPGPPVIVHNHAFDEAFLFPERLPLPCLHTLHCLPVAPWLVERLGARGGAAASSYFAVSRSAAEIWSRASGVPIGFVYNGLELDRIPFSPRGGAPLGWVGRISPEKGLHTALDFIEREERHRLRIFGRVYDEPYFEREIRHRLDRPRLEFLGYLPRTELFAALAELSVVLSPIEFDEPFGLTLIETMATGTPVVSFARGAAREIVIEGENGVLVEHAAELGAAVVKAAAIDRAGCRRSVVERFSVEQMAARYGERYRLLCERS